MARVTVSCLDLENILRLDRRLRKERYYVVVDTGANRFVFVPLVSSRHVHYYVVLFTESNYESCRRLIESAGFSVVPGSVLFE